MNDAMSEFTFSCPLCGQPIRCDTANPGSSTICPSCRHTVAIPQTYAPAGTPLPFSPAARPAPTGTSGLAVASFICSVFLCVGCIPGIICGHLARRKISREPGLGGNGFAIAGLVISYLSLVGTVGFGLIVLACMSSPTFMKGFHEGFERAQQQRLNQMTAAEETKPDNASVTPDPLWKLDLTAAEFPDQPAAGKVHGQDFTVESAVLQNGTIMLRQGPGNFGDRSIGIITFAKPGESLAGKTYDVSTNADFSNGLPPHVRLTWRIPNAPRPRARSFGSGYAMKLELGAADDEGKIPGKIYLCLPDGDKSYVAGTFTLEVKKAGEPRKPKKPASN